MMEHLTPPNQLGDVDNTISRDMFDMDQSQQQQTSGGSMALDSFDKIQVDLDSSDLAGLEDIMNGNMNDNDDLDKLLAKEAAGVSGNISQKQHDSVSGLNFDQLNLDLNEGDNLSLAGSESSMDKLLKMNIIEVDDNEKEQQQHLQQKTTPDGHNSDLLKEFAQGFLAEEHNGNNAQSQQYAGGNDPLLGQMSGNDEQNLYEQQQLQQQIELQQQRQRMMEQEQLQEQIEQQKQLMQLQAMMQQQQQQNEYVHEVEEQGGLTAAKVSQLASMGSEDLEREKMKLLNRLQQINSRQTNHGNMMHQANSHPGFTGSGGAMSGVASVMDDSSNHNGETPLSAFLRNKNKGANGAASASLLSQNVRGAPAAASVLDAAPMDFGASSNPFLRQATGGSNPLVGAMNKSSTSQNMIRQSLSGRNLRGSGVSLNRRSGQSLRDMLGSDLGVSSSRNAGWGSSGISPVRRSGGSSYSSSGIISRHASDGHLLVGATTVSASLAKTKNRVGSLSRENALYNMMKNKQGSHKTLNSLGRQSSHSRLSRTGSRGSLAKNDSFGSLLPTKRGGGRVGSKYKIGASASVPHLMVRGSPSPNNHGGNALW